MLDRIQTLPSAYTAPMPQTMDCAIQGRIDLPQAVIELHDYHFRAPHKAVFLSSRSFLDMALSPRPGEARGAYVGASASGRLGDILFVPAGHELATEWGAGRQQSICCGFEGARPDDDDNLFSFAELEACLDVRSESVRAAMLRLAREIEAPGFCSELLVSALWIEIAVELGRYLRHTRALPRDLPGRLSFRQLRMIEDLIEAPGGLPPASVLASNCGISTRHFFRMFRATTGVTLSEYAAPRRIYRAKTLLAGQRFAIKEIAWQCGFETPAAFSAAFRRVVGMTPKTFRRRSAGRPVGFVSSAMQMAEPS